MVRYGALLICLAFLVSPLAGCISVEETNARHSKAVPVRSVRILTPDKNPIPYAQVSAQNDAKVLALLSADKDGQIELRSLPVGTSQLTFSAPGFVAQTYELAKVPATVILKAAGEALDAAKGVLGFRKPVDLLCSQPTDVAPPLKCGRFGEAVMEVAGDGTIWASATCCIGGSPPIWISKDGGLTFKMLKGEGTGLVRDATGIEGDFAIDDAGNVYFFDILAGTSYFTSYTADGKHRHTAAWPYAPLVDRPWVRAGKADQVFVFYNTGSATNLYTSTNGGLTWDPQPAFSAPCGLGTPGQGPKRERLFVAACASAPKVWISEDAGKTWGAPLAVPMPEIKLDARFGKGTEVFMPPVADEAGNIYVPFTHYLDDKTQERGLFVARLNPDKTWAGPFPIASVGQNNLPWPAASRDGQFAVAWYHADARTENVSKAEWHLNVAASVDASSASPHFQVVTADPTNLRVGALGRSLGDFLEADLTPDGRLTVVYGRQGANGVENRFVSSDGGLDLSFTNFLNGPRK